MHIFSDMIIGIGTDIIEIDRIRKSIDKFGSQFVDRIYTEKEKEYCYSKKNSSQHFAARFAAKEAVVKSLASIKERGFVWTEIEIVNASGGKPEVVLKGSLGNVLNGNKDILISVSHSHNYVTAFAVFQDKT